MVNILELNKVEQYYQFNLYDVTQIARNIGFEFYKEFAKYARQGKGYVTIRLHYIIEDMKRWAKGKEDAFEKLFWQEEEEDDGEKDNENVICVKKEIFDRNVKEVLQTAQGCGNFSVDKDVDHNTKEVYYKITFIEGVKMLNEGVLKNTKERIRALE